MHYGIEHSMFEEEFAPLEPRRKFLTDRLLNHARAGKPDQRSGLSDIDVAEHRE